MVKSDPTDEQPDDDEVSFSRGFIAWWVKEKTEAVPMRAWEALEYAQRRAASRQDHRA
jgi:hypothetical protein